jgi:hypothetical protein
MKNRYCTKCGYEDHADNVVSYMYDVKESEYIKPSLYCLKCYSDWCKNMEDQYNALKAELKPIVTRTTENELLNIIHAYATSNGKKNSEMAMLLMRTAMEFLSADKEKRTAGNVES